MPNTTGIPADNGTPAAQEPPTAKKRVKKKAPITDPAPTASAVTKPMLLKIGRSYKKANLADVTEAKKVEFAEALLAAGVPILSISSGRIARVIKGEISIDDLKASRRPKA
jgi:hypothetical protein